MLDGVACARRAVADDRHVVPLEREVVLERPGNERLVFDDEDAGHAGYDLCGQERP